MKIRQEDYKHLEKLINTFVLEYNIKTRDNYPQMSITRHCFDIFHALTDKLQKEYKVSDYLFIRSLYDYLNDDHLETALKFILEKRTK